MEIFPNPYYPQVLPLRKKLEAILTPYLGTYGTKIKAIWVEPPSTPKEPVTGGLECVIGRYKNTLSTDLLLNSQSMDIVEWMITLKTNERTPEIYTKFDTAIEIMRLNFPYRRETINNFTEYETLLATFRIPDNIVFNTRVYPLES
jgi:hypothetical protein